MFIYKITNKINGKIYIGQTTRKVEERWRCHSNSKYHNSAIRNAIKKYSKNNFLLEIIEQCNSLEELNAREEYWINNLNTLSPNGYNLIQGGDNRKFLLARGLINLSALEI